MQAAIPFHLPAGEVAGWLGGALSGERCLLRVARGGCNVERRTLVGVGCWLMGAVGLGSSGLWF